MSSLPTIQVSAPASTMLMGEHAVLFGHRAVVCAVDQRIHVTLTPRTDSQIHIHSTLKNLQTTLLEITSGTQHINELKFVLASIQAVHAHKPFTSGFELTITSEFSHTVGLGSSACVTAGCVYGCLLHARGYEGTDTEHNGEITDTDLATVFDIGLQVIHKVQKRGSGSDLVASVFGGIVGYTVNPRNITQLLQQGNSSSAQPSTAHSNETVHNERLPTLNLYYSGYKTPTPQVLAYIEEQAQQFPQVYASIYEQMHRVTTQAETAINQRDWAALGKLMNIYHGLMCALGVSDAKLSELVYTARSQTHNLGAKISGSGLGDCIITLEETQQNKASNTPENGEQKLLSSALLTRVGISHDGLRRES